jgi:hypothetical protein
MSQNPHPWPKKTGLVFREHSLFTLKSRPLYALLTSRLGYV